MQESGTSTSSKDTNITTSNQVRCLLSKYSFSDKTRKYFKKQSESKKTSLHKFFAKLHETADLDLVVHEYKLDIGKIAEIIDADNEFERCIEHVQEKGKRLKLKLAKDHLYKMSFKDPKLLLTFLKHMNVIDNEAESLQSARDQEDEEDDGKFKVTLNTFNSNKESE